MSEKRGEKILRRTDLNIWVILIFLCCLGAVMVYSASAYECSMSAKYKYDSTYFLKRQLAYMILGFAGIFVLQYINYNILNSVLAIAAYGVSIVCILLLRTSLGVSVYGAKRWLALGPVQFQVAEVVKIGVIIMLAYVIKRFNGKLSMNMATIYLWGIGGVPAVLLFVISNDLSSSVVILGITFLTTLLCTKTYRLHAVVFLGVVIVAVAYILSIAANLPDPEVIDDIPFRVARIAAWLDPEKYGDSKGYQILQALYAIGSGGFFGKGLGNSAQKLGAIPEAQNDMIFSILCEELGVLGAVIAIGMIIYLLYQIYRVSRTAENIFGSVLCVGVLFHIGLQTVINIAVNCNLFPNTGLPLPFLSYGGTSVFCLLVEVGMVVSVERNHMGEAIQRRRRKKKEQKRMTEE